MDVPMTKGEEIEIPIETVISSARSISSQLSDYTLRASVIPTGSQQDFDCMPDDILLRSSVKINRHSIAMLTNLQCENQSLKKYRQTLLKQCDLLQQGVKPLIQLKSLEVKEIYEPYEKPTYKMPLRGGDQNGLPTYRFKDSQVLRLWENVEYIFKLNMVVKHDIVYGLTLTNNVYKSFIKIDKKEQRIGTYGPGQHQVELSIRTPGGFLGRGQYGCKIVLADKEGSVYSKVEYDVEILQQK